MRPHQNPYVLLAVALVLVLVSLVLPGDVTSTVVALLGVGAAAAAVVLFVRRGRDPNGPPGQH